MRELLEYMAFISNKDTSKYIEDSNNLFESLKKVKGALFTDNIKDFNLKDDKNIKLIMFKNEKTMLKELIDEF